jgi:hypothetical protein
LVTHQRHAPLSGTGDRRCVMPKISSLYDAISDGDTLS